MSPCISFERLPDDGSAPLIRTGPLMDFIQESASATTEEYVRKGGYARACEILRDAAPHKVIDALETAGLRGRGGGGFPTGHKWWIVANRREPEKYFICNANTGQPGGVKERVLLRTNPHLVIEAAMIATSTAGAGVGFLVVPAHLSEEVARLERAIQEARDSGILGSNAFGCGHRCDLIVYRSPGGYLLGEETALMEWMEGRLPQPRAKPPLPTSRGLFAAPTLINNLETLLQAALILYRGPGYFCSQGAANSSGTMVFSLTGHVRRPGLYELPLGTPLRDVVSRHGCGTRSGAGVKAIFPGGLCSALLSADELDISLDFDSVLEAGSDLGSGAVIVVEHGTCMVELAAQCARFYHEMSCGKCLPCKDGTYRTFVMLSSLERLDEKSIDRQHRPLPHSPRMTALPVLNNAPGGISYTDNYTGLARIEQLCEFFKHRGDCHHSFEAARSLQRFLTLFRQEFEFHRKHARCEATILQ